MTAEQSLTLITELFYTSLMVALPALLVSLVVGLFISLFQTVTSIQDQTLSYVPKIILVGLATIFTLGVTLQLAVSFTHRMMGYAAGGVR
jgi:flagellar biosynthesis protein FliQ